jgi:hypothetical protein
MYKISSDFELKMAENELKALMQQGRSINAERINQIEMAINNYLLKK